MKINKITLAILTVPAFIFIFDIYKYIHSAIKLHLCDSSYYINKFIVLEFIAIAIVVFKKYKIDKKLFSIFPLVVLFIFLLCLKLYMLHLQDIQIDIIRLSRVLLMSTVEILPLFLLLPYIQKNIFIKSIYIALLNIIIYINIAFIIYFYYTGEGFEYILFENLNTTSIKGFFLNISIIEILSILFVFIIINIFFWKYPYKIPSKKIYFLSLSLVLLSFLFIYMSSKAADRMTIGKVCTRYATERPAQDKITDIVSSNTLLSFFEAYGKYLNKNYIGQTEKKQKKMSYSSEEKKVLNKLLQVSKIHSHKSLFHKKYNRIIFIVFESLSIDFLHYYNHKIPEDATPFMDELLENYFHLNNFYTSNMPTDYGLTALLKSRIDKDMKYTSLFNELKKNGYLTVFLRGSSKFYGDHMIYYPKAFKYDIGIFKEEITKVYGQKFSGWGFNNHYVYNMAFNILNKHKNQKTFMVIKTIDFHQPGPKCEYPDSKLPKNLQNKDNLFKSLYWIDSQLKVFIKKLKESNLFDENTLIIVTADHNPHLGGEFKQIALKNNFQRLARIPMIFMTKDHDFNKFLDRKEKIFSQLDISPTILAIEGIKVPLSFEGRNIFEDSNRSFAFGKYKDFGQYINEQKRLYIEINTCKSIRNIKERMVCKFINNATK